MIPCFGFKPRHIVQRILTKDFMNMVWPQNNPTALDILEALDLEEKFTSTCADYIQEKYEFMSTFCCVDRLRSSWELSLIHI